MVGSLIGSSRKICRCEIIDAAAARYAENATKLSHKPETRVAESFTARSSAPTSNGSILPSAMSPPGLNHDKRRIGAQAEGYYSRADLCEGQANPRGTWSRITPVARPE